MRTTHNIPAVELLELADDTHANEHSLEITRYLKEQVLLHDPYGHALPTIGSKGVRTIFGPNVERC